MSRLDIVCAGVHRPLVAAVAVAVALAPGCARSRRCPPGTESPTSPPVAAPVGPSTVASVDAAVPVPSPVAEADDSAELPEIPAGDCGYDGPDEAAEGAEVRALLRAWIWADNDPRRGPRIEYRRGVLYVASEEDRGDDPPYPRSAGPEAIRACGSSALWLRSYLREALRHKELTCDGPECCYPGAEYAPIGTVTFRAVVRDGERVWVLDSWIEASVAALGAEEARANEAFVASATKRLAGTLCAGEPAGTD